MATGTTITTYSDREFLFRLQALVIDGGTDVLRSIFDQRLQNQPLNVVLANEQTTLNRLRRQKTITQAQYDLLFPSSGQPPTTSDFDITLIVCLLRNVPSLGLNQNYNWNVQPRIGDTSIEADVCRLRMFRNQIAHISSTSGFQPSSFQSKWSEIETVLLRLDQHSPTPNFSQTIDTYKYSPMDPVNEQRIITITEQWQERDRGLETDMQLIKKDVSNTKGDVTSIKKDVLDTKDAVSSIKKDVSDTKNDVKGLRKDVSDLKGMLSQEDKEKVAYGKMKSNLQDDLISFYKQKHRSIPLSPLLDEDQPLLKFYEMPDIQSIKVTRSRDGDRQEKTPVKTLQDVFYKQNKLCSNIYLMADAGYGKTTFSKKLALAWCQAKKPDESEKKHFMKDEITAMGGFSFVFVVLLRDSSSACDIDMLIFNQICSQLMPNHKYNEEFLATVLGEERCLVILDGLDEWTHPLRPCMQGESNIPHQRVRENVTVLTTTRPWKLSIAGLHSSQIDQKLELEGLSIDSATKLKKSVISHLYGEDNEEKINEYENEFSKTVKESHKSDLTAIPLFLMYLLFLWYYKFSVGKSMADLYSSFIELLLSRTVSKEEINISKTETVQDNIPPCINKNKLCKQFYKLLTTLGKLAFYTLFSERKENTLVFDGCVAKEYLSKEELTFCLKTGVITQSKVQGDVSLQQKTKVSFAHKTMQEFLAALYINYATDQKSVQRIMLSKCACVKDILDMSKLFMFIVSISARMSFSRELMEIINEDKITQEYRKDCKRFLDCSDHPLKNLQDMYISCCKEIAREKEVNLGLQDVFIWYSYWRKYNCEQVEYRENLQRLITRNKQNIRSVLINTCNDSLSEEIDYFSLSDLENIEKIHVTKDYEGSDESIIPLLNSSVKCLHLSCQGGSWYRFLSDKETELYKLEAVGIEGFHMSHREWSLFWDFISQVNCIREYALVDLSCTDHGNLYRCDLSHLSSLSSVRKLTLDWLKPSQVIVNMASLEECVLKTLTDPECVLKFINCADNKLKTFYCHQLFSSAAIDEIVCMLRESRHIRHVEFSLVEMKASALGELMDSILKLKQTVTVVIKDCTISQREDFEILKRKIKTSQRVRILEEEKDMFQFET